MDTFLINNEYFVSGLRAVTLNCHDPIGYLHMDTFFIFLYKVRRLGRFWVKKNGVSQSACKKAKNMSLECLTKKNENKVNVTEIISFH